MAETLVKDKVCGECGSEVRPDTLFCFHCGSALGIEGLESEAASDEPSDVWFKSEIATSSKQDKSDKKIVSEKQDSPVDEQEEKEVSEEESKDDNGESTGEVDSDLDTKTEIDESLEIVEKEEEKNSVKAKPFKESTKDKNRKRKLTKSKTEVGKPAELRSASTIRKREKPTRLKKVEIVWEERDESPNISFVIFAIFLSLLVAGLVFIAFYLK